MNEKHTLSCLVENHFGVLARIAGLISARAFNIDSLTVSATEDPSISRMTIVVDADTDKLEQVKRQLDRLVDVITVEEFREGTFVDSELLLARVEFEESNRVKLEEILKKYNGRIADGNSGDVVIEVTATTKSLDALVDDLSAFKMKQLVRTGRVALIRPTS